MKYEELFELVAELREQLPLHIESAHLQATIKKAQYDELLKSGFTADQALVLIK